MSYVEQYVLGIFVPMVFSGVLFGVSEPMLNAFAKRRGESTGPDQWAALFSLSDAELAAAYFAAGVLSSAGFFVFNRVEPARHAFACGLAWAGYFAFLYLARARQVSEPVEAERVRVRRVVMLPYVAGIWLATAFLGVVPR